MKYRKKPVIVEAFKYGIDTRPDWFDDAVTETTITTFWGDTDSQKFCMIARYF